MTGVLRWRGILGIAALGFVVLGCGGPIVEDLMPGYGVGFATADVSTGSRIASITLHDQGLEVSQTALMELAARVRVATWPQSTPVSSTKTIVLPPASNGMGNPTQVVGRVDVTLDSSVDGAGWFAISVAGLPASYHLTQPDLVDFGDGSRGIRIGPNHAPLVASILTAVKQNGVAVYVRFSEPVMKEGGALTFDYGSPAAPCSVLSDDPDQSGFLCTGTTGDRPFSLSFTAPVVARASGAPLAGGASLGPAQMQAAATEAGVVTYKPIDLDP